MKVYVADDSILIRNVVKEVLGGQAGFTIVGEAANGKQAVDQVLSLRPDIVLMDIDMPVMNGLEATCRITRVSSIPVLVFTNNTDPELPFKALQRGAADFMRKPDFADLNKPDYVRRLVESMRAIAARYRGQVGRPGPQVDCDEPGRAAPARDTASRTESLVSWRTVIDRRPRPELVVLGASTGGPQAVARLLKGLGRPLNCPLVLVQHIETGFDRGYADWLAEESGRTVRLAGDGQAIEAGSVYIAPTDRHLVYAMGRLRLDDGDKVLNQKPSVDVLFHSAAGLGERLVAVLLTGMGRDGAAGCAAVKAAGGLTLVQDEHSSLIYGMPKAAVDAGAASLVLPLEQISPCLLALTGQEAG